MSASISIETLGTQFQPQLQHSYDEAVIVEPVYFDKLFDANRQYMIRKIKLFDQDYSEYRAAIEHFLRCSIIGDDETFSAWKYFNFQEAFSCFRVPVHNKLLQHGLVPFDEFLEDQREGYSHSDIDKLSIFCWDVDDAFNALMRYKWEDNQAVFGCWTEFEELGQIYDDLMHMQANLENYTLVDYILMVDRVIHAQHSNGSVFGDEMYVEIDEIKFMIDGEHEGKRFHIEDGEIVEAWSNEYGN